MDSRKGEKAVKELQETFGCDSASFMCMDVTKDKEFCGKVLSIFIYL
jgi:hypothetical protein